MQYNSKHRPTLDGNLSMLSSKSGIDSTKARSSGERMIRQLEEKFKTIFEKVKEIMEKKKDIQLENEHLKKMIIEETQNQEKILQKCKDEIEGLAQQNSELTASNFQKEGKEEYEVQDELQLKNKQISDLSEQMKSIMEDLNNENAKCENYEKQILYAENEIQLLKMKLAELTRLTTEQENTIERIDIQTQDVQNSVKELMNKNAELEDYLRSVQEDQESQEEKYKTNLVNYRALLKKYNANVQKRQAEEKQLEKLKEELNSKIKRLDVVLINNHKLERKIKKIEELEEKINKIVQETEQLQAENEKYKKKIMLNIHSDYEKPIYSEKDANKELVRHAKKQQSLKISKLFADEDKLISHISQHTKNGVVPLREEEYIRQKDAQNEENFRRILEIKELERLKSQISQQDTYIKELARNIEEREALLQDQVNEISSLKENLKKLNQEIEQYESDRNILEKKYEEKRKNVDDMYIKYEEALSSLPEHLRAQLEASQETEKVKVEASIVHEKPEKKVSVHDKELEELLNKSPQTLEIRKK